MKSFLRIVLLGILVLSFTKCAKRGFIDGGAKDTIAPVLKMSTPANYSTNFNGKEIKLYFDEYVKLKDVNKQLIISPPMDPMPEVLPTMASKYITIKIKDTLKANTTYSFNFGQSIQDHNEGNPMKQFRFVMSTGSYVDSLKLGGKVKDAFLQETEKFVTVLLYERNETYHDSAVYKRVPDYVTNTLDLGNDFVFENVKPGKYQLIALKDKNNNFKFDPKTDMIGFHPEVIQIPNDTLYEVELFKEELPFKAINASLPNNNKAWIGYEGKAKKQAVEIFDQNEWKTAITSKHPSKDSLEVWFPKLTSDSLKLRIANQKEFALAVKKLKKDTLNIAAEKEGNLLFGKPIFIKHSTPIQNIDISKFILTDKDSTVVQFNHQMDAWNQKIQIDFTAEERQKYQLLLLPGAITDMFETSNDSLKFQFSTRAKTDYGNLKLILKNVKSYPLIVQLTDDKGTTKHELIVNSPEANFPWIDPYKYTIRFIYDTNHNGIWDTGNFLQKKQTEEVLYYPKTIDVRQNWDVEQAIDLGG